MGDKELRSIHCAGRLKSDATEEWKDLLSFVIVFRAPCCMREVCDSQYWVTPQLDAKTYVPIIDRRFDCSQMGSLV